MILSGIVFLIALCIGDASQDEEYFDKLCGIFMIAMSLELFFWWFYLDIPLNNVIYWMEM